MPAFFPAVSARIRSRSGTYLSFLKRIKRGHQDRIAILHILSPTAVEVTILLDKSNGGVVQSCGRAASTTSRSPLSNTPDQETVPWSKCNLTPSKRLPTIYLTQRRD
jgi:hypothetical protein